ncbi:O-antigen ligase family protein [Oceanospirillum sediminis]|uniref:O-antigen ligase family protein n=1 Tax=Oceanospirillum sediminis TaxID=2760088 RepID=A0A839IVV9_9GAMM|nr:O-antigen ligase family protein [Oceanospirillum sediminis]MBB1489088.1 O-antigen ligase family protein [Oceanospirillum sediminis]
MELSLVNKLKLPALVCLLFSAAWWFAPHPLLIVPLALLPLAGWVAVNSTIWICLGFIIFSFFRIHEAFPVLYPLKIPQLLALGALAVTAWHLAITHNIRIFWNSHFTGFAIFFVLVSIGLMFASNRGEAIAAWTGNFVKIGIMTLIVAWLPKCKRDFAICNWSILIAGILIALVALSNKANGIGLVEGTRVTISRDIGSMLGDPNDLSLVLLFPTSFSLALFFAPYAGKFSRFLALAGYLIIVSAIIATQSRGGLLGILAVTGVFAWQKVENKALLITAGGAGAALLLVLAGISDRSSGGAAEDGIDASAMGRIYAWQAAWNMAISNPLSGVGLNNFYYNYFFYSPHWDGKNHAVHSTWLGVLAETGFIGFIAFTTMVVRLLRNNIQQVKRVNQIIAEAAARCLDNTAQSGPQNQQQSNNRGKITQALPSAMVASAQATLAGVVGFMVSGTFLTQGFTWPIYILFALSMAVTHKLAPMLEEWDNDNHQSNV